ncbi:hypothetical protein U1Q18_009704 [Sarracenia purpurea var. burkii]
MASSSSSSPPGGANEARNWAELPRDVTATILQKLGTVDILRNAQKVCMTWRRVSKDPAIWRSIHIQDYHGEGYALEKMARHAIDRSCGLLLDICIVGFGTNALLQYLADRASQLKRLQIVVTLISDQGLSEAAKKLPLLEELCIRYCSISKEALKNVGCCCRNLKSLTFYVRGFRGSYDMKYYDDEARAIAENMPGLHYLRLIGHWMTDDGLSAILDGCPHLETLDLRQCSNVDLGGALAKRCSEGIKNLRCPSEFIHEYLGYWYSTPRPCWADDFLSEDSS